MATREQVRDAMHRPKPGANRSLVDRLILAAGKHQRKEASRVDPCPQLPPTDGITSGDTISLVVVVQTT
jgi:hypothetical protein